MKISKAELAMATQLVDSLSEDFDPSEYTDDYQEHLKQLIEAKIEKGEAFDTAETFEAGEPDDSGDVIDLMEALRQSVAKKRGEAEEPAAKPAKKAAAKKAAKAPAKKAAAKRAKKAAAS